MFILTNLPPGINTQLFNCAIDIKIGLFLIIFSLMLSKLYFNLSLSHIYVTPFLIDTLVITLSPTISKLCIFLTLLFPLFLILLPSLNLQITIFLE